MNIYPIAAWVLLFSAILASHTRVIWWLEPLTVAINSACFIIVLNRWIGDMKK